jgi:DNA-binding NarL/FixJ family response regulator
MTLHRGFPEKSAQPLLPIIHDPHLTAIQKLQSFLSALDRVRMAHKQDVIEAARVWYTDANAIVRQRVDEALVTQRAPLLTEIVRQAVHARRGTSHLGLTGGAPLSLILALRARLTRRELEVLELVARGNTNREMASTLVLNHRTVKRHLDSPKLDVSSRTAAAVGLRAGLG